jgi:hypothetical protein
MGRQVILHDADARGIGIMDIDEFAHAVGVILGGAPRGDFDLTPRPVDVEHDKEIERGLNKLTYGGAKKVDFEHLGSSFSH